MAESPRKPGRPAKYPWRTMEVGDTFFAPGRTTHSMHGCAAYHKPKRFRCREVVSNGEFGTRVWRIE